MAGNDERWTRADWARWFIDHDEVDEAARVLEPGDELSLGQSDYLSLAAALGRRGLAATRQDTRVTVRTGDGQGAGADLGAASRKPPARVPASPAAKPSKRTA